MDNISSNDGGLRELALFAGAGGGILGGKLLGWKTVCAVEYNAYARSVLLARQNDGTFAPFPIWDDVRTFDGGPWRGHIDVVSGGFPCQDISIAGKGAGLSGERSGLWSEMSRIIGEVRPNYVFVENSPMLVNRGLDHVLGDLAKMGYDAEWGIISASDVGAPHKRERIWILGYANNNGQIAAQIQNSYNKRSDCDEARKKKAIESTRPSSEYAKLESDIVSAKHVHRADWPSEPDICRVDYGSANRVDRIKALGNAQVPRVFSAAFRILKERIQS